MYSRELSLHRMAILCREVDRVEFKDLLCSTNLYFHVLHLRFRYSEKTEGCLVFKNCKTCWMDWNRDLYQIENSIKWV